MAEPCAPSTRARPRRRHGGPSGRPKLTSAPQVRALPGARTGRLVRVAATACIPGPVAGPYLTAASSARVLDGPRGGADTGTSAGPVAPACPDRPRTASRRRADHEREAVRGDRPGPADAGRPAARRAAVGEGRDAALRDPVPGGGRARLLPDARLRPVRPARDRRPGRDRVRQGDPVRERESPLGASAYERPDRRRLVDRVVGELLARRPRRAPRSPRR